MSQSKLHRLKVYSKDPGKISMGSNTLVELDGKPLHGVTFLKVEFDAKKVTRVTLDLIVNEVDIHEALIDLPSVKASNERKKRT